MKKQITKKIIPASTVVKGLITGFISYGILIYFLILVIMLGINYAVSHLPNPNTTVLSVSLPLLCGLFIYFLTHVICKLSTVDLFSKCKTDKSNYTTINKRMKTFFLVMTIVLVIVANIILCVKILNAESSISIASSQYSQVFSREFTNDLTSKMIADYDIHRTQTMISTIITEIAIILGLMSCVPLQERLLKQYNDTTKEPVAKEEKPEVKKVEVKAIETKKTEAKKIEAKTTEVKKQATQTKPKKNNYRPRTSKPKSANKANNSKKETK